MNRPPAQAPGPTPLPQGVTPQAIADIARAAGTLILEVYAGPFETRSKGDGSPVTRADTGADQLIRARLHALAPEVPIVSEESALPPFSVRRTWERLWLVDPLDGTREFVRRSGEFTVNIALIEGHRPVLGVVYAPVRSLLWSAVRDAGAFRTDLASGATRRIRTRPLAPGEAVIAASRSRRNPAADALAARLQAREVLRLGSSLKTCLVAEGRADVYPCFSATSEWDTAAPQCVLEEAGGRLADTRMHPLRYNCNEGFANPPFLAVGDPAAPWADLVAATG